MTRPTRIPTNMRTLLILEVLGKSDTPLTPTEINEKLGLPKQTVHRLCTTLAHEGFLRKVDDGRRYHPSRRLRELGTGFLFNSSTYIARRQILEELARQIRETINFVVPEASGMRYLDRVETDWAFQIQLPVGTNVPFHCTASGKCFLASLGRKRREHFVDALTLTRKTPTTRANREDLLEDLHQIETRGFALDDEEFMKGMVAIAVPVCDTQGRFVAALATHGPVQRLSIARAAEQKELLQHASEKLRNALFMG